METEITPEQTEQLKTWAGKRDEILLEISALQTIKDKLDTQNKEASESYTKIINEQVFLAGRIEELKKKESELPLLISKEIAELKTEKTQLETEVSNLKGIISILVPQKDSIQKDIDSAIKTFNAIKDESSALDKIVDNVVTASRTNTKVVEDLLGTIKKGTQELINLNSENVSKTNVVINKLPAMLVELQKNKLIRNKI